MAVIILDTVLYLISTCKNVWIAAATDTRNEIWTMLIPYCRPSDSNKTAEFRTAFRVIHKKPAYWVRPHSASLALLLKSQIWLLYKECLKNKWRKQVSERLWEKGSDRWWYAASTIYTWKHLILNYTNDTIGVKSQRRSLVMQDRVETAAITQGIYSRAHEQTGQSGTPINQGVYVMQCYVMLFWVDTFFMPVSKWQRIRQVMSLSGW